jgi:hypothetical protein
MILFRSHLELEPPLPPQTSRRMAMATWHRYEQNPQAYVAMDLDVTKLLASLEDRRAKGERVTLTHAFAAIVGRLLRLVPELRSIVRGDRIYPRKHVSLLVQVAVTRERLSAHVLENPDKRTPSEIAVDLEAAVTKMRSEAQDAYAKTNVLVDRLPIPVLAWLLRFIGTWAYRWNLSPRIFGLRDDPYGAMRLNNLGALGIDDAIGPFVDWMESPGTFVMMRVTNSLERRGEEIVERKRLRLWCAVDHRLMDGGAYPRARRALDAFLDAPEALWETKA